MARIGRLGRVVRNWAEEARERPDSSRFLAAIVELAVDAADIADQSRASDVRTYLAAATRLQHLMVVAERGRDDGSGDPWAAEFERIVGSDPVLGDASES